MADFRENKEKKKEEVKGCRGGEKVFSPRGLSLSLSRATAASKQATLFYHQWWPPTKQK